MLPKLSSEVNLPHKNVIDITVIVNVVGQYAHYRNLVKLNLKVTKCVPSYH